MRIVSFRDKRLKRYFLEGDQTGLSPPLVRKLRAIFTYLELIADERELEHIPHWRPHRLSGEFDGYWSLTLTRNWRLIFQIEDKVIVNIDLIDYH